MNIKKNIFYNFYSPIIVFLMIGFVVLDQAVKIIAIQTLSYSAVILNNFLSLEISRNYGVAFGFSLNSGIFYAVFLIFFFLFASGRMVSFKNMAKKDIFAVVCILSGAIGNFIDRVRFGYIIDFINFNDVVIFNLADVMILIGAFILIGGFIREKK